MSMDYVRRTYGVPAKRGGCVSIKAWGSWIDGTITAADHCVIVRPDMFPNKRLRFHPTDSNIEYINAVK